MILAIDIGNSTIGFGFIPDFARFSKQRREYCALKSACKSPGLPRKAGKSSSDLPRDPEFTFPKYFGVGEFTGRIFLMKNPGLYLLMLF